VAARQPNVGPEASKSGAPAGAEILPPGLYVVSTPIGNLGDVTLRALDVLRRVDLIACEDTRVTSVLLRRYGIDTSLTPYHDHNAERVRPELLARMNAGARVALVSDAGTPLLSDPGFKLVQACNAAALPVVPIPGASAMLAALVVAGLPTDRVLFAGFLPAKAGARQRELAGIAPVAATVVFYESAQRLGETLGDMAAALGTRDAAVCRELTKRYEEVRRGTLPALASLFAAEGPPRGEVVIVVGPPAPKPQASAAEIDAALRAALATGSVRDVAAAVAARLDLPKRTVYARALALSRETG
jgi:16S rRNA (cytidine1402-2'-O)-methyltransferase